MDDAFRLALESTIDNYIKDQAHYAELAATNDAIDRFLFRATGGVYSGLHRLPEAPTESLWRWTQPGNVGNTGGGSSRPHGPHDWAPGDPAILRFSGVPNQEDNCYFYMSLPIPARMAHIVDHRAFHLSGDLASWQAIEWQCQLTYAGKIYNMAWQFSFTSGVRIFDHAGQKWFPVPNVPMPDFTKLVTAACEYILSADKTTHALITLNGVGYEVGITQSTTPTTNKDKFTVAWQVDPKKGASCVLNVLDTEIRYVSQ